MEALSIEEEKNKKLEESNRKSGLRVEELEKEVERLERDTERKEKEHTKALDQARLHGEELAKEEKLRAQSTCREEYNEELNHKIGPNPNLNWRNIMRN